MILESYCRAFQNLPAHITAGEAQLEQTREKLVVLSAGQVLDTQSFLKNALYVRTGTDKIGTTYSENILEEPLQVMQRAFDSSRFVEQTQLALYNEESVSNTVLETNNDHLVYPQSIPDMRALIQLAKDLASRIQSACDSNTTIAQCALRYSSRYEEVVNSKGLRSRGAGSFYELNAPLIREHNGHVGSSTINVIFDLDSIPDLASLTVQTAETAKILSMPQSVPTGRYNIVLSADAVTELMYLVGIIINGYKEKVSGSCLSGKQGDKIGNECLHLVDTGSHVSCPMHFIIDNEGTPVKETVVFDKGVFCTMLHNRSTAPAGTESTGNAGRRMTISGTTQIPLAVAPKILYFLPGELSPLQMLEKLENGILITSLLDIFHGIDYASGSFSIPVSGMIVEHGKVKAGAKSIIWSGNLLDTFAKITNVGNNVKFVSVLDSFIFGGQNILIADQSISG